MSSKPDKTKTLLNLIIKCSAISFLFFMSILIVACSSNGTSQLNPGTPIATVTIKLGQDSPTPPLNSYYCGGWATDTSPPFSSTSTISIFGKFTHTVTVDGNSNPVGVGNATAIATIQWPDGTADTMTVTTTSDGLAVFPVAIKASAVNKLVTIRIEFTLPGATSPTCKIPQVAYFTAILVSPTPTKTAVPSPTNSATPTGSPTPLGSGTPSPSPTKGH